MAERGQSDLAGHAGRRFPVCTPVHGQRRRYARRVRPSAGRHTSPPVLGAGVAGVVARSHPVWRSPGCAVAAGHFAPGFLPCVDCATEPRWVRWYWQAGRRSRSCSAPLCCSFCGSRCRCGAGQRQAIFPILPSSIRPACAVCPRSCNDIWQGCWRQRWQVPLSADCIQHWSFSDRNSESIKPKNKKEVHSHEFHKKR